jgi:adenosylcobinamide hydrolase
MTTQDITRRRLFDDRGITADIVHHRASGVPATGLALRLPGPRRSLSGHGGLKTIRAAANCWLPKDLQEKFGVRQRDWMRHFREVHEMLFGGEVRRRDSVTLATGVDIENLAWRREGAGDTWVLALATAGVETNALRIGHDGEAAVGRPAAAGTINIILLTGATLPPGALAASFVTITEAKTVALQDLDIRSVYDPAVQASGTGTDEVLVVSGDGPRHRYVGGHTQLGETMARAVTGAVTAAVRKTHKL